MAKPTLLWLRIGLPSCHVPVTTEIVDTLASKAALQLHKQLLQSAELDQLYQLDQEAHQLVARHAQRSFSAVHQLKRGSHPAVLQGLRQLKHAWGKAAAELVLAYPALIKADKKRLKDLFEASDYPPATELRQLIHFRWQMI